MKQKVLLEDVWDWAYCPLRVWWRKTGLAPDVTFIKGKRTGKQLEEGSIRRATRLFFKLAKQGKELSFGKCLGLVWRGWLDKWELGDEVAKALVDYHRTRRRILQLFEDGAITDKYGNKYKRPMWTRRYRQMAQEDQLPSLKSNIDRHQSKIGIGEFDLNEGDQYNAPIGLAGAFANSMDAANKMSFPEADSILGVGIKLEVDLPSVTLICTADLVVKKGTINKRGRPRKDQVGPTQEMELEYEIFIFDEAIPSPYSLTRDLRVIALGQAIPRSLNLELEPSKNVTVTVRHIWSGKKQEFRPKLGDGADTLESLSRAVITGVRSGSYVPRMVCGWHACGECEYRFLCFEEAGVMELFNPPLMAQIESAQLLRSDMKNFLQDKRKNGDVIDFMRSFLEFQAKTPGLTAEGALWLLENLEAETR